MRDTFADAIVEPFSFVCVCCDDLTGRQPRDCSSNECRSRTFDVVAVFFAVLFASFKFPWVLLVGVMTIEVQKPDASTQGLEILNACVQMGCAVFMLFPGNDVVAAGGHGLKEFSQLIGSMLAAGIGEKELFSIVERRHRVA